jgi:tetratricopeptide (TPR) repeat protein
VEYAEFSANGRYVVTASWDNTARVWDAATGEPVTPSLKHNNRVFFASFSPDGRQLATADSFGLNARVWDLPDDAQPLPDLERLAQLLTAHKLDFTGGILPVDQGALRASWQELRRKDPRAFAPATTQVLAWHRREADACEQARRWRLLVSHLDPLVAAAPADQQLRLRRAFAHAELGEWEKATADYEKAAALGANSPWVWWAPAVTRLASGDADGYRRSCARALEHFEKINDPVGAVNLVWTCALLPDAVPDPARLVRLAEKGIAALPKDPWYPSDLGVALYRAGRYEEAVRRLNEAQPPDPYVTYHALFLAMSHARLGHGAEARQWLEKGVRAIEQDERQQRDDPAYVPVWWGARFRGPLLRREAEALIGPPLSR